MIQKNDFKETNNVSLSNELGRNNFYFIHPKNKQFVLPKINQCKLLRMAISCVDTKKPENKIYIEKQKIWDYLNYKKNSNNSRYTFLAKNIALLKTLQIVENNSQTRKNKITSFFSVAEWNNDDPFVCFEFDQKAMDYIVCKSEFFYYSINEIKYMAHKSSIFLFEFLISEKWKINIQDKCYVSVSIEELRKITFTQNQYTLFADWRKRILVPSVEEINLYTSYIIEEFHTKKYGKHIKSVDFVLRKKSTSEYQQSLFEKKDNVF